MKKKIFAVLAGVAVIATGCVQTVSDTNSFALSPAARDSVSGRYARPLDQVYRAAFEVIKANGTLVTEYVPHSYTNEVRSLEGRVNDHKVWIRVAEIDPKVTQVDVEARTKFGRVDVDLVHELEKEIALELAAH
jgi:PBP1b-binding outer membrane lipoprotein LpoB